MSSIYDRMNNINDDESLSNSISLKDALDGAIVVVVDDARTYDIQDVVTEFEKDHVNEDTVDKTFLDEAYERSRHIFIDPSEVKDLLDKVAHCKYFDIKKRPKNVKFMTENSLTDEDIITIIQQLGVVDYCYTLESTNKFHSGALLTVFITDKEFKLKDRVLNGLTIYAKIEYTTEGFVCVVSIHDTDKIESHPYSR